MCVTFSKDCRIKNKLQLKSFLGRTGNYTDLDSQRLNLRARKPPTANLVKPDWGQILIAHARITITTNEGIPAQLGWRKGRLDRPEARQSAKKRRNFRRNRCKINIWAEIDHWDHVKQLTGVKTNPYMWRGCDSQVSHVNLLFNLYCYIVRTKEVSVFQNLFYSVWSFDVCFIRFSTDPIVVQHFIYIHTKYFYTHTQNMQGSLQAILVMLRSLYSEINKIFSLKILL